MKKFNKFAASCLTALTVFLSITIQAQACTGVIVGSDLTKDGSSIFGRTEDLEVNHNKVFKIHQKGEYEKGEKLTDVSFSEKNGYTFEFPHDSYRFTSISDTTPEYGLFAEAGYNERGLIADMTVSASANEKIQNIDPYLDGTDESKKIGLTEAVITTVVLSTADNATDAIKLIADEVSTKGAAEGNGLVVSDKNDLWYMEIYSGHEFVAMKYPKDKFSVFPNTFWLNEVELTKGEETENYIISQNGEYIYSKGIFETAKKAETFVGNEEKNIIDLQKSYAETELSDSNRSRVCSGILAINPNSKVDLKTQTYTFLQDAKKSSIDVKNVMNFTRNRLENLNKEAEDKGRGDLYPIGNRNTMESHIFQIPKDAPEEKPGIMWLSLGSPLVQPYVAYYPDQTEAIKEVTNETNEKDIENSNYWLAMDNLHMIEANRKEFMKEIPEKIDKLEDEFISKTKLTGEENPDQKNKEDAKKSFDLQTQINKDLTEKYQKYLKENDYISTYYGRKNTQNFTSMTLSVPKDTSLTYLNLKVKVEENPTDGTIEIVDNYGNPIEEIKNPVTIKIPKQAFESMPKLEADKEDLEVKEEDDKYVITTQKSQINFTSDKKEEKQKEKSQVSKDASTEEKTDNKENKGFSKTLIIGLVVIAGAVAYFLGKSKKNK